MLPAGVALRWADGALPALKRGRRMNDSSDLSDFYQAHYRQFDSELASSMRREIYGEDLGQTGWRSVAEQAEIAALLDLGPGRQLLDIGCGSGGPTLALAERTSCGVTGLDVEPAGVAYALAMASARSRCRAAPRS